ncbi:vacuolar sorting protein Vps33 [Schizosaccharomyces japonicus yFS275]|uniref:Vacuolar sorting protein Vps33 n=1 Tax=Schizosaccharomyces japonicus (strain yFS275 / FY16936) TaxID=402676 RepID=B6JVY4_SCHJY|nr:vacuolar sorting protein Vps33 [Schizosaccharomyces japonicus yFS275]EEB05535.1 vacuolar sorting protein Vps33 [Schizosaccharomyces japonicus yFS275]
MERARNELLDLIDSVVGKKSLVLEKPISGVLSLLIPLPALQEHGIQRIYTIEKNLPENIDEKIVYICRPSFDIAQIVSGHIHQAQRLALRRSYTVITLPKSNILFDSILQEQGVFGEIDLLKWNFSTVVLDDDLLSMELSPNEEPTQMLSMAVDAVFEFEKEHGLFPRLCGRGPLVDQFCLLREKRLQEESSTTDRSETAFLFSQDIDSLLIFDRSMDMVTPLMTQLTFEGLLDEAFGINQMFVKLPPNLITDTAESGLVGKKFSLHTHANPLFKELRDLSILNIGPQLGRIGRKLSDTYNERKDAKTVGEIKSFVSRLGALRTEHSSLNIFTSLAEALVQQTKRPSFQDFLQLQQSLASGLDANSQLTLLDSLISRMAPAEDVLRMLCLASVVSDGLRAKDIDVYRREITQTYGYEHLITLHRLMETPLLQIRTTSGLPFQKSSLYQQWLRTYPIIVENVNEQQPDDIAYTYGGYGPLSVHILRDILEHRDAPDAVTRLTSLPGKYVDYRSEQPLNHKNTLPTANPSPKTVVILFLGGCTYAELSALRFLQEKLSLNFVFITTGIINGSSYMGSFVPKSMFPTA